MTIYHQKTIERVIVHCSDSPDVLDIGLKEINEWHKARGFEAYDGVTYCGYHWVVRRSGVVEEGRPEDIVGAHVEGHNHGSIGIVWVGRTALTDIQRIALLYTVKRVLIKYALDESACFGHHEFNTSKTCPNFDRPETFGSMESFRETLKTISIKELES